MALLKHTRLQVQIKILNKGKRNQLICERKNGEKEITDVGPNLPFHDLAHYVVEKHCMLTEGFYGNIYNGYSIQQLSEKEVIKKLPVQSAVAEIITRVLQALGAGACTINQFVELIMEEFKLYSIDYPLNLKEGKIKIMLAEYEDLINRWQQLKEGEFLNLKFEIEDWKNQQKS